MNDETVLITGASSGIGLELARCFAADGCRLILAARNQPALEQLAVELRRNHRVDAVALAADLSASETPRRMVQELRAQKILVDVLVNNAGFGAIGAFDQLPLDRQMEMLQVNVTALTALTGLLLPDMIARRRGGILNVASVAGFVPGQGMAVYYATKAFVLSFTEALAVELKGTGVTVSALCPGPTMTNFGNVAGSRHANLIRVPAMSAAAVARAGHRAFRRRRAIEVPGGLNKLLVGLIRFSPRSLVRTMAGRFNGFRRN